MNNIMLRDALALTDSGNFSIKFVSFDKRRKGVGGEIISIPSAIKVGASHNRKVNDTIVIKPNDRSKSHPYTIHTHLIIEVNKREVTI